jgi:peptidoglycan hydrolase CwlO-like protein
VKAASLHIAEWKRVVETAKKDLDDATKTLTSERQSHVDLQLKSRDQLDSHTAHVKTLENQYAARIKDLEENHAAQVDELEDRVKRYKRAIEAWDG